MSEQRRYIQIKNQQTLLAANWGSNLSVGLFSSGAIAAVLAIVSLAAQPGLVIAFGLMAITFIVLATVLFKYANGQLQKLQVEDPR